MTTITESRPFGRVGTRAPSEGLLERAGRGWKQWRLYQQTLSELEALSDRDLADLGLFRSDVPRVARETVYGN